MADFYSNSIFWVELDKVRPNPYQPRREFEEGPLRDLSESIRQYGVMQPLTVSRVEYQKDDGGIAVEYELIAGERRLRASKLAGLSQVPVLIRQGDTPQVKLELAIIENLQRADLNPVERAHAFARLANEFKLQHAEIGKKLGRSREYVSNTLRILALPDEILTALGQGKITEGHTRPLLMLIDRPMEQMVLFKEIMNKKVTVREAERAARNIAVDRARKAPRPTDPEIALIEARLQEILGERVHVETDAIGGRVTISFLTPEDLKKIVDQLHISNGEGVAMSEEAFMDETPLAETMPLADTIVETVEMTQAGETAAEPVVTITETITTPAPAPVEPPKPDDSELYSISSFSI